MTPVVEGAKRGGGKELARPIAGWSEFPGDPDWTMFPFPFSRGWIFCWMKEKRTEEDEGEGGEERMKQRKKRKGYVIGGRRGYRPGGGGIVD